MAKNKKPASASADATDKAAPEEQAEKKPEAKDGDDVHAEALKRYDLGYQFARRNIEMAYEDLRFAADDDEMGGQWDQRVKQMRDAQGRPVLTVNKCPQFVRQVTGDMRQMKPAIKCVPVDDSANEEVAKTILPGMLRYIENRSDAAGIYFQGADCQVTAGIGHWRVLTEYAHECAYTQEIRIGPVSDQVAVVWDPDADLPTREDAMWCFVPSDLSRDAFEKKYPDKSADPLTEVPASCATWTTDEIVRVCEYWVKTPAKKKLALLPDGSIEDVTEGVPEDTPLPEGTTFETRDGHKVTRYLISASDILEGPDEWPGAYIPIVPVIGEEIRIGREVVRRGVIRPLKDPQRIYNYSISTQTEVVALQPKAPFIGTHTHFEDNQEDWELANRETQSYLSFKPDPEAPGLKPERSQPPIASAGLAEVMQVATTDMHEVTGIYPASLGAHSNETSGKAIMARQREGDTGTFVYVDNWGRAIRYTGKIIVDLIPHIYDTQRTIRIVGEDGKIDLLEINKAGISPQDGITPIVLHDLTIGAYDVTLEMGPSFSTRREEARDGIQAFMQAAPQAAPLFIDLFAKMQDWPLADKIAKRAHLALLPPQVQAAEAQESGEPPPPQMAPPAPSPEQQAAAQQQQQQHSLDQGRLQVDAQKLQVEMAKIQAELRKAELDHQVGMAGHQASIATASLAQQAPAAAAPDPRVDELAQSVDQMKGVLQQIVQALSAPPPPVPQPDVNQPIGAPPPNAPPQGALPQGL